MRTLFIYYRVAVTRGPGALQAVQSMQHGLRERHADLKAELLRRPEEKDGMQTWMETYSRPGGVDAALEADIAQAAEDIQRDWIQGPRFVEAFVPCA